MLAAIKAQTRLVPAKTAVERVPYVVEKGNTNGRLADSLKRCAQDTHMPVRQWRPAKKHAHWSADAREKKARMEACIPAPPAVG